MPTLHVPDHVWAALSKPEIRDIVPPSHAAGVVAQLVDAFPHVPDRDWQIERLWDPRSVAVSGRLDDSASVVVQISPDRNELGLLIDGGHVVDECALWPVNDLPAWVAGTVSLWGILGRGWTKGKAAARIVFLDSRTAHPWFVGKDKPVLVNWRQDGVFVPPKGPWVFPLDDKEHQGFHFEGLPESDQPTLVRSVAGALAKGLIVLEERNLEGWTGFPTGSND